MKPKQIIFGNRTAQKIQKSIVFGAFFLKDPTRPPPAPPPGPDGVSYGPLSRSDRVRGGLKS